MVRDGLDFGTKLVVVKNTQIVIAKCDYAVCYLGDVLELAADPHSGTDGRFHHLPYLSFLMTLIVYYSAGVHLVQK